MICRPLPLALLLLGGGISPGGSYAQAPEVLYDFNFDQGESGFTTDTSTWRRWYMVDLAQGNLGEGLEDGIGRDKAWGSNPLGLYPSDLDIHLWSPDLALNLEGGGTVEIWHRYDTQLGGDGGQLRFAGGDGSAQGTLTPWGGYPGVIQGEDGLPIGAFTGSSEGWSRDFFDLGALEALDDGALTNGAFGFNFTSNGTLGDTGWFIERMIIYRGDAIPPLIRPVLLPKDTDDYLNPYAIEVQVEENGALERVSVDYQVDLDGEIRSLEMDDLGEGRYGAELPAQPPGSLVSYRVVADDSAENSGRLPNVVSKPSLNPFDQFLVEVLPPQGLSLAALPPRITTEVDITWARPSTDMPITAYNIYRSAGVSVPVTLSPVTSRSELEETSAPGPLAQGSIVDIMGINIPLIEENRVSTLVSEDETVALTLDLEGGTGDYVAVTAVYELPEGDLYESGPSELLILDVAVPSLSSIQPDLGYQGQELVVTLIGKNTDFSQGQVGIDVGEGVLVQVVEVLDVTRLRATLWIEEDAVIGERPLTVSVDQALRGRGVFTLAPSSERPAITSVDPPSATQGQTLLVKFEANGTEFVGEAPTVDFGVGVLVVGDAELSDGGRSFTFPIQVEGSCPVGERSIIVKTEGQVFTDVPFEIRPGRQALDFGCSHTRGEGAAPWLLLGLLGIGLRRRRT